MNPFSHPRSVLVTGANGFTGAQVLRCLLDRGISVRGLVREKSDLSRLQGLNVELFKGDLTNTEALTKALKSVDWVIHTAAYVDLGIVNKAEMHRVNVEGTQCLLQTSLASGITRFVHCSTIGVLGDTAGEVADENWHRLQQGFSSAYDETKFRAQRLVESYNCQEFQTICVLPSGIMGAGDPHFGPVVDSFLKRKLMVWAGSDRITGVVHVSDVAELLVRAAERGYSGESYIASSGELTTRQIFEIVGKPYGLKPPKEMPELIVRFLGKCFDPLGKAFSFNPPLSSERVHYVYDRCVRVCADKARSELDWRPMPPKKVIESFLL